MASACVNNNVAILKDNFFDSSNTCDWFNPRSAKIGVVKPSEDLLDLGFSDDDAGDFEFRLEDPVKMLPADELFSDGKLMPLHISTARQVSLSLSSGSSSMSHEEIRSASVEEILKSKVSGMDPYLFSPKAPRCSSGWRELLGLKKLQSSSSSKHDSLSKTPSKSLNLKHFMHKNPKFDPSLGLPLLKETDSEPVSVPISPRVSLDSLKSVPKRNHPPRVRLVRRVPDSNHCTNNISNNPNVNTNTTTATTSSALGVSMDSPRMNSSGKVVFQSLERSSSSPSTFNGGPRVKYKGMERRSYSANVKVSTVLNVPVCSLRGSSKFGLGQLFPSPHKKGGNTSTDSSERTRSHHHHHHQSNKQKPIA